MNPRSGDQSPSADELAAAARERGLDVHLLKEEDDVAALARKGSGPVGIAGGDGSLGEVAGVAADEDRPFVCIPFGTRNHFARDLGLDDEDPIAALAGFEGEERRVDIGLAGDRWFLNNVSLGVYASFVHDPARKTRNRLVALFRLLPAALGRSRTPLDLSLDADGRQEHHSALLVLVANNGYKMQSMAELGSRDRLDEGRLHAYVIEEVSRSALVGLLFRAVAGSLEQAEGWSEWEAEQFRLEASRDHLHAAVDGEPVILPAPLEFKVRPRGLRVLVPPPAA
ncbi:MAG TPA: diacylglycerol kinase family protein [Gaiellaceae bacterium]|nr:diacylglycerol kinase family protein [Gaiellaceae bacterium]